jgi:hypothetical protein
VGANSRAGVTIFLTTLQGLKHTQGNFKNPRKKHFPNPSLFWAMLWWERYQMYGKEGIQKALQELQQRPPTNEEAWLKLFIEDSR